MPPIIYIFSLCAFAFGFSEFIPMGLSSVMAVYFKVNISEIGLVVTTYAAGFDQVAKIYPQQVALLVAFDLFIGNGDRARNLKAALATPHIQLFAAFDHSHALLGADQKPENSISQLKQGDLLVRSHWLSQSAAGQAFYRVDR